MALVAAIAFAVLLSVSSAVVLSRTRSEMTARIVAAANAAAMQISADLAAGEEPGVVDVEDAAGFSWLTSTPGGEGDSGVVVVESRSDRPDEGAVRMRLEGPVVNISDGSDGPAQASVTRWVVGGEGATSVTVRAPLDSVETASQVLTRVLVWSTAASVAAVAGLCWLLVGRALSPVDKLRRQLDAIQASTYDLFVAEPKSADELGRLAVSVNNTLGRLAEARRQQRQFVADASHELRTPIAVIRALTEVASRSGNWEEVAPKLVDEADRLELLVDDLLELARMSGGAPAERVQTDVATILMSEGERLEHTVAPAKGKFVAVDTTGVQSCVASVVPGQVTRAVRNLIVNAGRHAKLQVSVSCRIEARHVVIEVGDDGSGIPAADRERVFERFTRLDEGRSRDSGGSGLGLALVQQVARAHGGEATVGEDPSLGGALFTIRFPARG